MHCFLALLAVAPLASAVKTGRTFAVNHFYGNGPLTSGRADPIISPGAQSGHVHSIQGGSNFALTMSDTTLLSSSCTSSLVKADKSNYWTPSLYFQHSNGSFEAVPMFYMNVYYFFEATNDKITAFPPGLRMVVGDVTARSPPYTSTNVLDLAQGAPQPVQWTCPRSNYNVPSYPAGSDGLHGAGIADPNNKGAGVGFPDVNCDGYASPLRADIHFPSCYNPAAGLDNYKTNMQFPSSKGTAGGRADCPEGWIHTPHLFYEVYWNTPLFKDMWTQGQGKQPFVLANGDPTGYSLHGDFISGWDVAALQQIIDNCDAGDSGMDKCPGLQGGLNDASTSCNIPIPRPAGDGIEQITGILDKLPGNNPVVGFGQTVVMGAGSVVSSAVAAASPAVTSAAAAIASAVSAGLAAAGAGGYGVASPAEGVDTTTTIVDSSDITTTITRTVYPSEPTGTSDTTLGGFTSMGCYSDSLTTRALQGQEFVAIGNHQVTTTACIAHCSAAGFTMAGLEYGGQCFCGDELLGGSSVIDGAKCNMSCEGDASQVCGGSLALSMWKKSGASRVKARSMRHLHHHLRHHS